MAERRLTVVQMLPALAAGGVEKGTIAVARDLVAHGHRSSALPFFNTQFHPCCRNPRKPKAKRFPERRLSGGDIFLYWR